MKKVVVIYKSIYGSTERYAKWIGQELNADIFTYSEINAENLIEYETIIYGGGLYASGISGVNLITKNYDKIKDKKIIVFTVGLASTDEKEIFSPIINKNFSKDMCENINFFHLRGSIDYKKLSLIHKSMMGMLKLMISKKKPKDLSKDDKELLATYGGKVDYVNKDTIIPILNYLREE